ncbi:MAG: DUF4157 domain-containing protein, partial [Gammaproteobacteria bacterium]|nr:DUF4157 domain-containing protein [Gammaproteobacteria bacterium]
MHSLRTRIKGIVTPLHYSGAQGRQRSPATHAISNLAIQDKLLGRSPGAYRVSHHQDAHEIEADRMADSVMRHNGEQAPVRSALSATTQVAGKIQGKSADASLSATASNNTRATTGSGQPLPHSLRHYFEPRFGHDLSQVRIHDDAAAHATAKNLNARAYTQNYHIGFDAGQYNPGSAEGKHLLAHELAHVSQQTDANTIYCETWNVDDSNREIERELVVQLLFENTWTDMWNGTGWTDARKTTFSNGFVSSIENTFNNGGFVIKP